MHYSVDPAMVRVDIWKASGKWYTTEQMKWLSYDGGIHGELIHDIFASSIRASFPGSYIGMTLTCLEPYHAKAHPLMIKDWQG